MQHDIPTQLPEHADVADALSRAGSDVSPAEAHGLMCGYLCSGKMEAERCIKALIGDEKAGDIIGQEAREQLRMIFVESAKQLPSLDLELQLLLPGDEVELPYRAEALGDWCFGFLSGLQLAGLSEESFEDEDVLDALDHFDDIANVDYENVDFSETNEQAFAEISEYVRMAAIMIYQDQIMRNLNSGSTERVH